MDRECRVSGLEIWNRRGIDSPRDVHCNNCMYGDGKDAIADCSVPTAGIAFDAVVASIPGAAATTTTTTTTSTRLLVPVPVLVLIWEFGFAHARSPDLETHSRHKAAARRTSAVQQVQSKLMQTSPKALNTHAEWNGRQTNSPGQQEL